MKKQPKVGLVDADIVAYEVATTGEVQVDWDDDGSISQYGISTDIIEAKLDDSLASTQELLKLDTMIICLTDKVNFRHSVLPSYKSNRSSVLRPLHLAYAKEYMSKNYETYVRAGLEADDVMGILATHPKLINGKKIIISIDKDMKTIPAWLYNPNKDKKPRLVSEREATFFHMEQTVTGDAVDGYKGCPKAGKVAYDKALDKAIEAGMPWANHQQLSALLWKEVVAVYESKELTEADALVQARVARICQWQDYDYTNNEVILWRPPTL